MSVQHTNYILRITYIIQIYIRLVTAESQNEVMFSEQYLQTNLPKFSFLQ